MGPGQNLRRSQLHIQGLEVVSVVEGPDPIAVVELKNIGLQQRHMGPDPQAMVENTVVGEVVAESQAT